LDIKINYEFFMNFKIGLHTLMQQKCQWGLWVEVYFFEKDKQQRPESIAQTLPGKGQ
jgi:hypothetical protein